ncbi:MAG: hypothetical protein IJZ77_02935 [Bacilli bacterium]|nr:hypothetical protein [Bacilli bacterium]
MSKTYWLHRTSISPMFINLDSKNNGLPTLMSFAEYSAVATDSKVSAYIHQLPHDLWLKKDKNAEEYIRILNEAGVTLEDYLQARQQNYQEQLNAYFENGLYIQRDELITTVTRLDEGGKDPQKELDKTLKKEGLGFRTGNDITGVLSNRQVLNVAIILELPEECISNENPQQVFEEADKPLSIGTAYFGLQKLTKVIPSQYIKGAFVVGGADNRLSFSNPNFDSEYIVEDGYYDANTITDYIGKQLSKDFDIENIYQVVMFIDEVFDKTKSKQCITELEKVISLVGNNLVTPEADDLYVALEEKIVEMKRNVRTQMEVLADDLIESDLENLTEEEIVEHITKYLSSSKDVLRARFKENAYDEIFVTELDSISKALDCISPKVYEKLQKSYSFNDIYGEVEMLKRILSMKEDLRQKDGQLIDEVYTADAKRQEEIRQENVTMDKQIMFLNYAMCSNPRIAQNVIKFLKHNDVSKLSPEECIESISKIKDITKRNEEQNIF